MILLYGLSHSIQYTAFATANSTVPRVGFLDNKTCIDINNCRTIVDILTGCFSIFVISVLTSIYPNVPDFQYVGTNAIRCFLNNSIILCITIIAPEVIVLWALRQRYSAFRIAKKYQGKVLLLIPQHCISTVLIGYGWTKAHGFLALMKGIALFSREGVFICYLEDKPELDEKERRYAEEIDKSFQWGDSSSSVTDGDQLQVTPIPSFPWLSGSQ
ncbi:hypothetical protein L218DRAFT_884663 [Marasmius fiardii PR-910]|nr:hypothetical protein L218DRAFT_884663 [Marasmius fiardii PR-910]